MKYKISRYFNVAIVSTLALAGFSLVSIFRTSNAYAVVCPGTNGQQAPDNDVANCPSQNSKNPTTPTSTSGTQPADSGLNDPLKTGECPSGQSLIYVSSSDGPTPKCIADDGKKCGSPENRAVDVSFDFGCLGPVYGKELNPIVDMAFALFRFLSAGVGLLVIGSVIFAGIQYSASRGNPQATGAAIKRITNAIIGLLIYIFMFAILNFIIPGGLFL